MGQYHYPVNLDKKQFVHPHRMGTGLKLWEQLANSPGTAGALVVLLASGSNGAGGGDLEEAAIVGTWCGDRIAFVGDYDEGSVYLVDGKPLTGAKIYEACSEGAWTDVSDDVCEVLENELNGEFEGSGWRTFKTA